MTKIVKQIDFLGKIRSSFKQQGGSTSVLNLFFIFYPLWKVITKFTPKKLILKFILETKKFSSILTDKS